jgi:hypothetical protein
MPMMKLHMLNVTAVSTRKVTIQIGCAMRNGTNSAAVARIVSPRMMDFVAAAPT